MAPSVVGTMVVAGNEAGVSFSPDDLPNLRGWWRADDVELTILLVDQWNDLSGNGYHLTPPAGPPQQIPSDPLFNGQPSLDFIAPNTLTGSFGESGNETYSIYCAVRNLDTTSSAIFELSDTALTSNRVLGLRNDPAGNTEFAPRGNDTNAAQYTANTNALILSCFHAFTERSIYENGALQDSNANDMTIFDPDRIHVGELVSGSQRLTGQLAELIIYDVVHATEEKDSVEGYMSNRYDIALA